MVLRGVHTAYADLPGAPRLSRTVTWEGQPELVIADEVHSSAEHDLAVTYVLPAEPVLEECGALLRFPDGAEFGLVADADPAWTSPSRSPGTPPSTADASPPGAVWRTRAADAALTVRLLFREGEARP